ncbi:MAG: AMP-dependent synthetase and ligase [Caulobacter sp.]|nr:AMP-dependent synthetase and ligase [Caulobacter sp.]
MNTALLLEMAADGAGERVAIGSAADGCVWPELLDRARSAAGWLASRPAGTVAHLGLNSQVVPVALYAAGLAAKPFAPLNYRLPDADLRRITARTAPSVVIADEDMAARVQGIEGVEVITRAAFLAEAGAGHEPPAIGAEPDDIAILLFTSGTTGEPKAAVLRHRHLTAYVLSSVDFLGAADDEAALVSVPPYHVAGVSAVLSATYLGRRTVYLESFTPEAWVALARDEAITHAMVVPTMLGRVLDVLEEKGERLATLRHLSYGGGRMPAASIERALKLLPHVDFVNAYGLTETSSTVAVLSPQDHREAVASADVDVRRRLGSVGRPLPALELEIRGAGEERLAAGELGEIWVRGEQVAGEYLGHRAIRDDGWFPTNDSGWLDEGGFLFVEGRLDDVIVRGGENISPGEIEDVLRGHPGVADVAVIGLPDDEWGERVAAVVSPTDVKTSAEELGAWVRARLRSTKTPELFEFRDVLPYNETGKLLRRTLKQELSARPAPARPAPGPTTSSSIASTRGC